MVEGRNMTNTWTRDYKQLAEIHTAIAVEADRLKPMHDRVKGLIQQKVGMIQKLQEALKLDQQVSLMEGLAELGQAAGMQAELRRLQGEIEKHQKYESDRQQMTAAPAETAGGLY